MNISSLVVIPIPGQGEKALMRLKQIAGLEVNQVLNDGRMIVVMERETTKEEASAMRAILDTEGVAAANMAYHYFEEETLKKNEA